MTGGWHAEEVCRGVGRATIETCTISATKREICAVAKVEATTCTCACTCACACACACKRRRECDSAGAPSVCGRVVSDAGRDFGSGMAWVYTRVHACAWTWTWTWVLFRLGSRGLPREAYIRRTANAAEAGLQQRRGLSQRVTLYSTNRSPIVI